MNLVGLIADWARLLRCSSKDISLLILRAPHQYKHYQIPKRTGGMRDIYHPSPNLKALQRWLTHNCLHTLSIHPSVFSYRAGYGIRQHAFEHLHSNFLLRLDFSDFFPSVDAAWVGQFLRAHVRNGELEVDQDTIESIVRLVCRFDKRSGSFALSIGAPSSPMLSNAMLFDADVLAAQRCEELGCIYTRYADDIYVSSREKGVLGSAQTAVRSAFSALTPQLRFNEAKTLNLSKKARRVVTGITLTPDRKLSVGRQLKRKIKTQVFLCNAGKMPAHEVQMVSGLLAFVRDVEPAFFESLCGKFGTECVERIFRNRGWQAPLDPAARATEPASPTTQDPDSSNSPL